ncbi:hypothetical protein AV530_016991 [Patagioenas fasciata monilis]|uniref:Uncharacterized protein n=1 Tax=Patagioenas fasciata monilis TaxID=372326 RepID=A0A1V4J4D0_PATFA|nr:hypothetical protein AV530_016991 [Patagioenas fasciata monilis]
MFYTINDSYASLDYDSKSKFSRVKCSLKLCILRSFQNYQQLFISSALNTWKCRGLSLEDGYLEGLRSKGSLSVFLLLKVRCARGG